jgi:hypothetical protein
MKGDQLVNSATDKCGDISDSGKWSGNLVQVWGCYGDNANQRFTVNNGQIKWNGNNMCWDLKDGRAQAGTQVQIWSCYDHNANQQWTFDEVDEVDDCDSGESSDVCSACMG